MLSSRPYLARALYEWLINNDCTPYIIVDAEQDGVQVPKQFVQNGQVVLNIAPTAVRDLLMGDETTTFSARFGGQPMQIIVPNRALIAIYARENGVGMVFGHEPVMPGFDDEAGETPSPQRDDEKKGLESVEVKADEDDSVEKPEQKSSDAKRKGRASLRVIK